MFSTALIHSENVFGRSASRVSRRVPKSLTSQEVIISITNIRWIYNRKASILSMFQ